MEMAVCADYGISHSHFLGGPRRWSQSDRDKAIWWHVHGREQCGECGTRRSEWYEADGKTRKRLPPFKAKKSRCPGCEARQRTEASIRKEDGRGVHVVMERQG